MKSKYSSLDVAKAAGVSQATVSRALRNSPTVRIETRNKIKAIAYKLHYKVDKNASNLRKQQNNTIALLILRGSEADNSIISPFFASMLGSITENCFIKGVDLLISFQRMGSNWHSDFEESNKADGLILLGYENYKKYENKLNHLIKQDTNLVTWGAKLKNPSIISVSTDNFAGAYEITQHVINQNRKKLAFVGDISKQSPESLERYLGYCKAMNDNNLKIDTRLQVDAVAIEDSGYNATNELLSRGNKFDAIIAASDRIAIGSMLALREHNYKIPSDISIVGFDDIPQAKFCNPQLTTMRQSTGLAGLLLVEKLLQLIKGETPKSMIMPTRLIVRKSCGANQ